MRVYKWGTHPSQTEKGKLVQGLVTHVRSFPVQSNVTSDQVGVTWWCGTTAHQVCPGNSACHCLWVGITQLFIQPLPLLDSRSSTDYKTCQQWACSWTGWINQKHHISERNPKPTIAQTVRAGCKLSVTTEAFWCLTFETLSMSKDPVFVVK